MVGLAVFFLRTLLPVGGRPAQSETVIVSAAASLTDALQEIGKAYQAGSRDRIELNFGASSLLARQIEEGAPVDLILSADEASLDRLAGKNLLAAGTRRSLLSNTLVIVVENGSPLAIDSPRALASDRVRSVALAEPDSVPAGIYAREYLQSLGIWEKIRAKVIPTENVRGALAAVEAGNADAAIVYRTDARISERVRTVFEVPALEGPKISYGCALVRGSSHPEAARKFLFFLESPASSAVFRRYGFLPKTGKR
jgi:molybdenum ABC transporter, periplasmic molybdate-binding protein